MSRRASLHQDVVTCPVEIHVNCNVEVDINADIKSGDDGNENITY